MKTHIEGETLRPLDVAGHEARVEAANAPHDARAFRELQERRFFLRRHKERNVRNVEAANVFGHQRAARRGGILSFLCAQFLSLALTTRSRSCCHSIEECGRSARVYSRPAARRQAPPCRESKRRRLQSRFCERFCVGGSSQLLHIKIFYWCGILRAKIVMRNGALAPNKMRAFARTRDAICAPDIFDERASESDERRHRLRSMRARVRAPQEYAKTYVGKREKIFQIGLAIDDAKLLIVVDEMRLVACAQRRHFERDGHCLLVVWHRCNRRLHHRLEVAPAMCGGERRRRATRKLARSLFNLKLGETMLVGNDKAAAVAPQLVGALGQPMRVPIVGVQLAIRPTLAPLTRRLLRKCRR